ncbi:hypothetical protein [Sphingobacterium kitahiroshimense]|uniref:hypothetical protein n=1 Tax=Sphingobacterium kitahiroshimense TaxID=470446 RepID=UPI003207A3E4
MTKKNKTPVYLIHIFAVSILVTLFIKLFYLDFIPEIFSKSALVGKLLDNLGYGFISGYSFYLLYEYLYRRPIALRRFKIVEYKLIELIAPINQLTILFYIATRPQSEEYIIHLDFKNLEVNNDVIRINDEIPTLNVTNEDGETVKATYKTELDRLIKQIETEIKSILSETILFQHNDFIELEFSLMHIKNSDFFKKIKLENAKQNFYKRKSYSYQLNGSTAKMLKEIFSDFINQKSNLFTQIQLQTKERNIDYRKQGVDDIFQYIHSLTLR